MFRFDRRLLSNFDVVLFILLLLVCGMALLNLYSSTFPPKSFGHSPFVKQIVFLIAGLIGCFIFLGVDYQILHRWNYPLYIIGLLLLLVSHFAGNTAGGAQRWINLGIIKLQPSEPAKLILVIALASYYARREIINGYTLPQLIAPILLTAVPFCLIMLQPDLGTAMMLGIIFVSITVFVGLRFSSYAILGTCGISAVIFAWFKLLKPYQRKRIETFLNPEHDQMGQGYQIMQSKIAVGSGGQFGRGYLEGTQGHLHFLPERHTDFAFAVWSEEWGFAGCLVFVGIYFLMLLWGVSIAMNARDRFGVILSFGVLALIFWQAVINLLMILGWLPVVGIPLPFFSYGGSSLLTTLFGFAILLNVKMRSKAPANTKQEA